MPEPDNPYDPNCIRVISARGIQIGNVSRDAIADWVGRAVGEDRILEAWVRAINDAPRGLRGVVVGVAMSEEARKERPPLGGGGFLGRLFGN